MGRYSESLGLDWQISDVGTALDETLHVARDKKSTKGPGYSFWDLYLPYLSKCLSFRPPKFPRLSPDQKEALQAIIKLGTPSWALAYTQEIWATVFDGPCHVKNGTSE